MGRKGAMAVAQQTVVHFHQNSSSSAIFILIPNKQSILETRLNDFSQTAASEFSAEKKCNFYVYDYVYV